ncbi:hypothetical protein D1B33_07895 [Lysinibacillus yapensis]|uniref:Uncharacterized protein n=1 Tax=Ureibacillus yapensis TaxID=2304605 RepID=A0A396SG64_9BACL|nr:hypothetical protein [Lysinibacillus yapensis]RHW37456.1 hypothetical protein D1B33_07895 [Lysinibacillus yapensis]
MRQKFNEFAKDVIAELVQCLVSPKNTGLSEEQIEHQKITDAKQIMEVEFALYVLNKIAPNEKDPLAIQYLLYNHAIFMNDETPRQYTYAVQKLSHWFPGWRIASILEDRIRTYRTCCQKYGRKQISFQQTKKSNEQSTAGSKFTFLWQFLAIHDFTASYEQLCHQALTHEQLSLRFMTANKGLIADQFKNVYPIGIPDWLQANNDYEVANWEQTDASPISITYDELIKTAQEMDNVLPNHRYEARMKGLSFYDISAFNGQMIESHHINITGTEHWVGPLGAGKSTFMKVLAYHLAHKAKTKKRLTIFLKDIAEVIELTEELLSLQIKTEAIISHNERKNHIEKYLRYAASSKNEHAVLNLSSPLARRLLSICPLLGFNKLKKDFSPPCFSIVEKKNESANLQDRRKPMDNHTLYNNGQKCVCPYLPKCPYASMYTNLKDAQVIVTTIQSTINTNVPSVVINKEMTFYEFLNLYSDVVILDESDKHQLTLDDRFMPDETLFDENSMYLATLQSEILKNTNLMRLSRTKPHINEWVSNFERTSILLRDIASIIDNQNSQAHIKKFLSNKRFTSVLLLRAIIIECHFELKRYPNGNVDEKKAEAFKQSMEAVHIFNQLYKAPDHYEKTIHNALVKTFLEIVKSDDTNAQLYIAENWLSTNFSSEYVKQKQNELAKQLILALNFVKLEKYLAFLSNHYSAIESELNPTAKSYFNFFGKRRRLFDGVTPVSYIGVQYGFILENSLVKQASLSRLKVFNYEAIGRFLLTSYSNLYEGFDHKPGAHAILLSATSLAPNSPKFNVQLPVKRLLVNRDEEDEQLIRKAPQILYTFAPQYDEEGAIRISGVYEKSEHQIERLTKTFVANRFLQKVTSKLPQNRQRSLLVMSSYEKSKMFAIALHNAYSEFSKEIAVLVKDFEPELEKLNIVQITRDEVSEIAINYPNIKYVIIPLEAIDRGMNILLDDNSGIAAFSCILYLMRPYPVPSEQSEKLRRSNIFALESYSRKVLDSKSSLQEVFNNLRKENFRMMQAGYARYGYQALKDDERDSLLMDYQVIMYQLEGRLLRGGSDAFVYFIDSAFMPNTVEGKLDTYKTSMIEGWLHLNERLMQRPDHNVLNVLYETRFEGLKNLKIDMPILIEDEEEVYEFN